MNRIQKFNTFNEGVTTNDKYTFIKKLTKMVVDGKLTSLIITGEGGIGKTYTVMNIINKYAKKDDIYVVKGYSTPKGLYNILYEHNGQVIVFDDCDSVLDDKVAINILKSALDSYDKRTITWSKSVTKNDTIPTQFDFNGRVIFISNKSKDFFDKAILSRCVFVDLTMTNDEKLNRMYEILPNLLPDYDVDTKIKALSFLYTNKDIEGINLNIRTLIKLIKIIGSYPNDWQDLAEYTIKS